MSVKEFKLDAKSAGAQALEGLWGPGPPGDLLYDMSAKGRGRGNHGSRVGTGNVWAPSERGMVMEFNGVDDAWNCERALATNQQSFTFCCWAWLDSTCVTNSAAFLGIGDAAAGELMMRTQASNNVNTGLRTYGDGANIDTGVPPADFNAFENSWAHVGVTRQMHSAVLQIYLNGLAMRSDATANQNLNTAKVLQIGCADSDANRWFKGFLDDVRYYTRALSIGEISHIYNATRWTPYADISLGRIRYHGSGRRQTGHVRRAR